MNVRGVEFSRRIVYSLAVVHPVDISGANENEVQQELQRNEPFENHHHGRFEQ